MSSKGIILIGATILAIAVAIPGDQTLVSFFGGMMIGGGIAEWWVWRE